MSRNSISTDNQLDSPPPFSPRSAFSSISSTNHHYRQPSMEEAIDSMEKEQEGIVLKLLHEIQYLKEENKQLKSLLLNTISTPNYNSVTSSPNLSPIQLNSSSNGSSSINGNNTNQSPFLNQRRNTITTITNMKRVPQLSSSISSINNSVIHNNTTSNGNGNNNNNILMVPPLPANAGFSQSRSSSRSRSNSGSITPLNKSRSGSIVFKSPLFQYGNSITPLISHPNISESCFSDSEDEIHLDFPKKRRNSFVTNQQRKELRPSSIISPITKTHKRSISDNYVFDLTNEYRINKNFNSNKNVKKDKDNSVSKNQTKQKELSINTENAAEAKIEQNIRDLNISENENRNRMKAKNHVNDGALNNEIHNISVGLQIGKVNNPKKNQK